LVRAVVGDRGPPDAESTGRLLEGWIAQLLRAYRDYRGICDELAYWAPAESRDTEVDFLRRRGRERVAIEVKASRRWKPEFAKGLRAIADLPGVKRRLAVYLGVERLRPEKGIEALPLEAFLVELARGLG
jgi:predicted AAA+ superfamily ATPase